MREEGVMSLDAERSESGREVNAMRAALAEGRRI